MCTSRAIADADGRTAKRRAEAMREEVDGLSILRNEPARARGQLEIFRNCIKEHSTVVTALDDDDNHLHFLGTAESTQVK